MKPVQSCLGICYTGKHLFYSVNQPGRDGILDRIGCIDFNFDVGEAISSGNIIGFPALKSTLEQIKNEHNCDTVKLLAPATEECWSLVPRSVYEDSTEREAHVQLMMKGSNRNQIQVMWHAVSNTDTKLLLLRNSESMAGFDELLRSFNSSEYVSDFELGMEWQLHTQNRGSFVMIHCMESVVTISSFILGKLRGTTYLEFDSLSDLPYLWSLYSEKLSWMSGMHDEAYVFGEYGKKVSEMMQSYWYDHGTIHYLDSLLSMNVDAKEKTYGFRLETAFPAIIMSLNNDIKETV
jgi:hypothetical protein